MDERTRSKALRIAQGDLPAGPGPFAAWAREAGLTEARLLEALRTLRDEGVIRRFGGVFDSRAMGWTTTLVGARVDRAALEPALERIAAHPGATHVYVRDDDWNVWFTLAVREPSRIDDWIEGLKAEGLVEAAHSMPQKRLFKLKVRFPPTP